jgi:hypothetical protein
MTVHATSRFTAHLPRVRFALGVAAPPAQGAIVRLTNRFRGRAVRCLVECLTNGVVSEWSRAPEEVRQRASGLAGKDASGTPLEGHRHAHYLLWSDDDRHYTRLVVWRRDPFEAEEIGHSCTFGLRLFRPIGIP